MSPPRTAWGPISALPLHYLEQGQGPGILFLHGLGSSAADWQWQIPVFAERYHVIAPDLRAHGQSPAPGYYWTIETLADDVAQWLP